MPPLRRFAPGLGIVLASGVVGTWLGYELLTPKAGVGVSREDAPLSNLPQDARNVTYYLRPPASYYEFDTSEDGFREFVVAWGLPWKEVKEGPGSAVVWDHRLGERGDEAIADGIFYGWWEADATRSLAYDRRTGRAYCSGTTR
jgi:hypothetical protein